MASDDRDTMHSCEACERRGCAWCSDGLQNRAQFESWIKFRKDMQSISATYTFLRDIVLDVLKRLDADGSSLARLLETEGRDLLDEWQEATPGSRNMITDSLKEFNRRALDYLQGSVPM